MDVLRMAFSNLFAHKLRSGLTVLGVLIGVMAVLMVVTVGQGLESNVVGEFDSIDDKRIFVTPAQKGPQFGPPVLPSGPVLTETDVNAVLEISGVASVGTDATVPIASLEWGGDVIPIGTLRATYPDAQEVRTNYDEGRVFNLGAREVVLGRSLADGLSAIDPVAIGDQLQVRQLDGNLTSLTVVGILAAPTGLFGDGATDAWVPIDPFYDIKIRSPTSNQLEVAFQSMTVEVESVDQLAEVKDQLSLYFAADGPSDALQILDTENFRMSLATASDIQEGIGNLFDTVTAGISSIAIISLIVGAIGIANIMLVSVTERTKEIGMLKAIGAPSSKILRVFLLEAALLGLFGALLGTLLGLGAGQIASRALFDTAGVTPIGWVMLALGVGALTGVLAGFLPALRATRIEIVRALSDE